MSISLYPTGHIELHVSDPGDGWLSVLNYQPGTQQREFILAGFDMWIALRSLTELATQDRGAQRRPVAVDNLWSMSIDEARAVLPALQTAILYAAADTERGEQLTDHGAHGLLCSGCNKGSAHAPRDCEQHGPGPRDGSCRRLLPPFSFVGR